MLHRRVVIPGAPGTAQQRVDIVRHVFRQLGARLFRVWDQAFLAGMRLAVERKQHVEIARQQRGNAMIDAGTVAAQDRQFDLVVER